MVGPAPTPPLGGGRHRKPGPGCTRTRRPPGDHLRAHWKGTATVLTSSPAADGLSRPRVLGVDGNSLGHRGFHSARDEPGSDTRPFVTGAVVSMLASAWVHGPYDAVVVAFDHPTNHRKLDYPEYKANRPPAHPELTGHLGDLRRHLGDCGFMVVEVEGCEADDLLAATADGCCARGWSCDLLSSDRDLTALVGPTTRLLRPLARFADLRVEDERGVRERYGIDPSHYVDFAALRGDTSDGLIGATGIGAKTAARLVRDHGTVAGIYASLTDLAPKVEAALREARERVERNLVLMAPIPHLDVDLDRAAADGIDLQLVTQTLEPLGLGAAARRFAWAVTAPPPPPTPPPPDEPPDALAATVPAAVVERRRLAGAVAEGEQVSLF